MKIDNSWSEIIEYSYDGLSLKYRKFLEKNNGYFPDFYNFLNSFSTLPLEKTKYILFGQDPYPRKESANGYAFIDANIKTIFSDKGFSKEVNRATSLRNFLKMLLLSQGYLSADDLTQRAISAISKQKMIYSINDLRLNFEKNGILLLNSSLIFTSKDDTKLHIKEFKPFLKRLLSRIDQNRVTLILFGKMAQEIKKIFPKNNNFATLEAIHPYNIDFIYDKKVHTFFKPLPLITSQ